MSEIVERVKAALQKSDDDYGTARNGDYWEDMARAAIEAMREPTEAMVKAAHVGEAPGEGNSFCEMWEQAIDAALKEPT